MFGRKKMKDHEEDKRRFHSRRIHVDSEVKRKVIKDEIHCAVNLHEFGLWGDVSQWQKRMNDRALKRPDSGARVQSIFQVHERTEISVCTCLRSLTTTVTLRCWAKPWEIGDLSLLGA